jgi:hypothetical protein
MRAAKFIANSSPRFVVFIRVGGATEFPQNLRLFRPAMLSVRVKSWEEAIREQSISESVCAGVPI